MKDYDATTYGDAFADVYDDWYADISDVDATVAFVGELAGPAGRVLELAVGTGRLALPLAAAGLHVVGVDASEAMLDKLRSKPGSDGVRVIVGDMASDLPDGPFDVALVAYNSLFALEPTARRRCLTRVASCLAPGGHLVVEAFVPDPDRPAGGTVDVRSMSAHHVVLSVDVHHPDDRRAEGHFIEITEAGGVRLRPWQVHYAGPTDLDAEAEDAGLEQVGRWADWDRSPFDAHSARHVTVYRR